MHLVLRFFFLVLVLKKLRKKIKEKKRKGTKEKKKRTELQKISKVWMSDIEIFTIISFIIFHHKKNHMNHLVIVSFILLIMVHHFTY